MSQGVPAKDLCSGMTTLEGWVISNLKTGLMYPEGYDQAEFMVLATLVKTRRLDRRVEVTETMRTWYDGDEVVELKT